MLFENFSLLDYIIFIIVIVSTIYSFYRGFVQSLLGLLTWIGAVIITLIFYEQLALFIASYLNKISFLEETGLSIILSTLLSIPFVFLTSLIILKKIRSMISSDFQKSSIGNFLDKILGFIYGAFFGLLIISVIFITINNFANSVIESNFIRNSYLYPYIDEFNKTFIIEYSPKLLDETNQIIEENSNNID